MSLGSAINHPPRVWTSQPHVPIYRTPTCVSWTRGMLPPCAWLYIVSTSSRISYVSFSRASRRAHLISTCISLPATFRLIYSPISISSQRVYLISIFYRTCLRLSLSLYISLSLSCPRGMYFMIPDVFISQIRL